MFHLTSKQERASLNPKDSISHPWGWQNAASNNIKCLQAPRTTGTLPHLLLVGVQIGPTALASNLQHIKVKDAHFLWPGNSL